MENVPVFLLFSVNDNDFDRLGLRIGHNSGGGGGGGDTDELYSKAVICLGSGVVDATINIRY